MAKTDLPIDVVPQALGTRGLRFRWSEVVGTPAGDRTVPHEGALPSNVERPVAALVEVARRLQAENERLREDVRVGMEANARLAVCIDACSALVGDYLKPGALLTERLPGAVSDALADKRAQSAPAPVPTKGRKG